MSKAQHKVVFDDAAVARAEQALRALSSNFQGWLEEEVGKVQSARLTAAEQGWSDETLESLLSAAHDVKGLGATYEYPLATRIAASLCRLLETPEGKDAARAAPRLIVAHVDAMRAAARDHVKTAEDPVGRELVRVLEQQVDALGVAPV